MTKRITKGRAYIAFGSNLHRAQMATRCPTAYPIGTVQVKDWRLVFRGVADIEPHAGGVVHCGVWRIKPEDEEALDRYEGVKHGLYRKASILIPDLNERALVYLMNDCSIMPPSEGYANTIRQGYRDFGLPMQALDDAIAQSWDRINPSDRVAARYERKGRLPLATPRRAKGSRMVRDGVGTHRKGPRLTTACQENAIGNTVRP